MTTELANCATCNGTGYGAGYTACADCGGTGIGFASPRAASPETAPRGEPTRDEVLRALVRAAIPLEVLHALPSPHNSPTVKQAIADSVAEIRSIVARVAPPTGPADNG